MIEFDEVSKTYPDGTTAVENLSMTLPSEGFSVIVGPSGCGKTTTLRMINRMIDPTRGKILWDGTPVESVKKTVLRRQMGYVIQNGGLFPHRTVLDNIGTVPTLLGWKRGKIQSRARELLGLVGLDPALASRYPAQLSGGQQQRVGVARALAAEPVLLLMDEPFSAVDPVVRQDLQDLVARLQDELGTTIVMITHDIDEAIRLGDKVAILRPGGVLAQFGTPEELLDDPADDFVAGFVGRDRGFRALTFASGSGLTLDRVRTVRDPRAARPTETSPVLAVDKDARPLGWATSTGTLLAVGTTFHPQQDSLRGVVDAVLASPVGQAVAVDPDSGRLLGIVGADAVMDAVRSYRLEISTPEPDPAPGSGPDAEAGPEAERAPGAERAPEAEREPAPGEPTP